MRKIAILLVMAALAAAGCEKKKDDDKAADKAGEKEKEKSDKPLAEDKADKKADPKADPAADPKADPAADPKADPAVDPKADPAAATTEEPAVAPDPKDGFVMPDIADKVGEVATKTEHSVMKLQFDAKGQKIDLTITGDEVQTREELEVVDGESTKRKVSYKQTKTQSMKGKDETSKEALDGKTYIVWNDGTGMKATHEDGSALSAEEEKELRKDHKRIGKRDGLEQILRGRAWKKGEAHTLSEAELAILNEGDDDAKGKSGSITFEGEDGKVAAFRIDVVLEVGDPAEGTMEMTMAMTAKGEIATGHLLEMGATGTIKGTVKGMPTTGTLEMKAAVTYP